MADKEKERAPRVATSAQTLTIAFPFSQIKQVEATAELRELAQLIADLSEQLAKANPSVETDTLAQRARAISTRLDA
jgi:uncharacterized coiled-coil DUF342 family protein